jgi:3-oxoadipate enol-lactonase
MDEKRVAVGETWMNVLDRGSGPPILLVHGFPLDHTMWRFQVDELSKRYRVICPDLSGFGASPASVNPISIKGLADDLAAMLESLNVNQPVVFCGLSMGGYIGWQFWKHHSEKLSHLVACDTRAASDSQQVARGRRIMAQTVRDTGSSPVADAMVEKLFYQSSDPAKQEVIAQTHAIISQTDPLSIASGQLAMAERVDATAWLSEINVPVLFVVGEHDEITPPVEMRQNADLVSRSTFLQLSDAGHMAPLENPDDFNRGLINFLD